MREVALPDRCARVERIFQHQEQMLSAVERVGFSFELDPAFARGGFDAELLFDGLQIARIIIVELLRQPRVFEMECFQRHMAVQKRILSRAPGGVRPSSSAA